MSSAQELRRRIKSVTSTEQVARAMRTSAVSKYTRTHKKAQCFAPYREECLRLLSYVGDGGEHGKAHRTAGSEQTCYVVLTANRGLCGGYNEELFKFLLQTLEADSGAYSVIICGKWGADRAEQRGVQNIREVWPLDSIPTYAQALKLYRHLRTLWEEGTVGRVAFLYQSFKNILVQTPVCEQLLPARTTERTGNEPIIFEPDWMNILPGLREQCLTSQVYGILLAAAEGASGAMLTAMRTAAENSGEMLSALEQELNRLRQSAVTTEVLEISSGAAAEQDEGTEL